MIAAIASQGPDYAGEGGEGIRTTDVLRAVRYLPRDHCPTERSLSTVVGRLNAWIIQETQQVAPVMVPTEFVLQPPVVRIRHGTVAEMIGRLSSQPLGLGGKVRRLSSVVCLPELHRFSEQAAQTIAEAATSPSLGLDHLTDRAQHVGQTFLLLHPRQSLSIVAPSSIRYHHPSIVRGHHLTYLFVAVTSTNLVHRSLIRFERHQKSRPAVHSPSRVVGVDEWTGTHRTPQLMVGIPHCTPGTSQRVLADRPLAQLHTSQRSEHSGDLPYRNAHSIVEHVGRRHHSSPYPVRAGPVLVRRNIGMPPSDLLTAGPAPAYLYPVPRHLGSGNRRNVGCVDNPHSLMLESASTSGASVLSHRHLYKRLGDFIGRRRLSVAERPHTRLAAGTLGSAASPTLGERSRLALSCSLELGDLLVQLFVGRRQLRNLPLQLRDQPHQLVALRGREVFGLTHSQSMKTCSVPHNPPTDADPANQLRPLDLLELLSEEAKAKYTWDLLALDDTYKRWTMRHNTQEIYPRMEFESPAIEVLRQHGGIETRDGISPLSDGLGDPPQSLAVLFKLLSHPKAAWIRQVFELQSEVDSPTEPIGADAPVPLVDEWPGLRTHLSKERANLELVRCDGFQQMDGVNGYEERDCIIIEGTVYVTRKGDERDEIAAILRALGLQLDREQIERILLGLTDADVQAERDAVRERATDAERLLAAVGEFELRQRLPSTLITILERSQSPVVGIRAAMAGIATFHTGALREYRDALVRLDPPKQWAGSQRAVEFVRSLGFGEEWAGERNPRRDPYVEVEGPYSLPELHDYQRKVVGNARRLIHSNGTAGERRGMISMPTGSGKTRVAVQAIVEAMREDGFKGGILWVADRDELCEQAVEAWRQVWASEGAQATQLRISRMWAGQPQPLPTGDMHVIVATIQTLAAKINRQPDSYGFLADFKLLVFDEAHRSVAPTFTSVMLELGLTRWRRSHEPLLIGLTATPYRGHDVAETARLASRYGSNRLDSGAFTNDDPEDVIRELQTMRILAQADHDTIEGGRFSMSDDELQQSRETPWLPRSVEGRIADDIGRTQRIVQAYKEHIDSAWPTLIFATSVEHAQTVAALLASMGVRARAVSAATDTSSRRRIVEEFRAGEIKALVNYGIFREGFDAPKTRAIIVARPVYSPNLYFQMIGRGLRGVKNGGNDRCLILNVRDNIDNFERKLAFSELDWLWA